MPYYGSRKFNHKKKRFSAAGLFSKKTLLKTGVFLLIVFFIYGAARASKLKIKNLDVKTKGEAEYGTEQRAAEIKTAAEKYLKTKKMIFLPNDNIFLLNKTRLAAFLLQDADYLKSVNINKDFPSSLAIEIEIKRAVGVYCLYEEKCYLVAEDGKAARELSDFSEKKYFLRGENRVPLFEFPETAPVAASSSATESSAEEQSANQQNANREIKQGEEIIKKEELALILNFTKKAEELNIKTEKIKLLRERTEFYFNEGWFAILDRESLLPEKQPLVAENLKIVLDSQIKEKRKKLQYIDLRFMNKVFYKLK